ncbi:MULTISPECIES: cytochrome b [unclassified Duganella]|uniref:cytochrome b n=1 Tax=unclassified Duganella TaxID=2636909 RepID=UPI0007002C14|nr:MULTISPECIES: cytochrome b [unclassified Duganella]KQN79621.1 cytochrome B [Duganella sp. Leaf61]MPQ60289.1 cytochrome b [Duganella sp. FT27W]
MQRYTKTAMLLHWLIALMIIAAFFLGLTMVAIPGFSPTKLKYFSWHKWIGVTVLALVAIRLLWRLSHKPPAALASIPPLQHKLAEGMHYLLYFLMFAAPISGYLYGSAAGVPVVYLKLVQLPMIIAPDPELKALLKTVHYVLVMTMAGAVVAHALAALKHHFFDRDTTLKRMLPF